MPQISLTYGVDRLALNVPDATMAGPVLRPRTLDPMTPERIRETLRGALASPVDRPLLRHMVGGKSVAVVVSDEFRSGLHEHIIAVLCEELRAGAPAQVTFLCATGTHDPAVYTPRIRSMVEQNAAEVGLDVAFVAHDCDDPALVPIGVSPLGTEVALEPAFLAADVRVYGHEAKHHYMHGYSLVDKQVIPGIADRRAVEMNHKRSLSPDSGPGRSPWHDDTTRQANPFSEDSRDIRAMAEQRTLRPDGTLERRPAASFALDMISDTSSVYWVAAGDPAEVSRRAIRAADRQAAFVVERTRYAVISPGGPPASQAMYGVQNCFDMAMKGAVESGGEVLVVAPCDGRPDLPPDVRGLATSASSKALFWDNLVRLRDRPLDESHRWIDEHFQLYLWKTYRVLRNFKADRVSIHVHSQLAAERLTEAGFVPVPDPQAWIDERVARADGKLRVIDNGNKMLVIGH
jgi:nickel-dependent lactate racemase